MPQTWQASTPLRALRHGGGLREALGTLRVRAGRCMYNRRSKKPTKGGSLRGGGCRITALDLGWRIFFELKPSVFEVFPSKTVFSLEFQPLSTLDFPKGTCAKP